MSNVDEVAPARPADAALSAYAAPALAIDRSGNVATPAMAVALVVPPRVAPAAPPLRVRSTDPAKDVSTLPLASRATTVTAGAITAPATALVGWPLKASAAAAPWVMSKLDEVAPVTPIADAPSMYPLPALSMDRPANVATPAVAAAVVVPDSVPLPGLLAMTRVTLPPVAVFPEASMNRTATAGLMAAPATAFDGWTTSSRATAGPAPMS